MVVAGGWTGCRFPEDYKFARHPIRLMTRSRLRSQRRRSATRDHPEVWQTGQARVLTTRMLPTVTATAAIYFYVKRLPEQKHFAIWIKSASARID